MSPAPPSSGSGQDPAKDEPATPPQGAAGPLSQALPKGACDSHVHVIGDARTYPMLASRPYTPGPASLLQLQAHLGGLGLERTVIIQPSFYGTDNRCTLQALDDLQGRGRAVLVLDEAISDAELQALDQRGARGIRLNIESSHNGETVDPARLILPWAERLAPLGWHIQLYARLPLLARCAQLPPLPVPLVFDHFAMLPAGFDEHDADVRALQALLRAERAWVKLSAPYRLPGTDAEHARRAAQWLLQAHPHQVLWGSDWPHTQREPGRDRLQTSAFQDVAPARLAAGLAQWLERDAHRQAVLVENPARLYRF